MLRARAVLKLTADMRDDANGLTSHVLATSGLGFKMSGESEKSDDNILSATK